MTDSDSPSSQKDLGMLSKYWLKAVEDSSEVHPGVIALTLLPLLFHQPKSLAPEIVGGRLSSESNGLTPLSSAV